MAAGERSLKTMMRVFRRESHRILDSERTTVHGADNMLLILQLAAAEVYKQERGDFTVALSDVLQVWKSLLLDKLQLSQDASPPAENYELIRREYESFLKRSNTLDLIDVFHSHQRLRRDEDPDANLSATQLLEFLLGNNEDLGEVELAPQCPATPSNRTRTCSAQMKRVVRRLFCSYLGLLVNSKDDLALAHTLNSPNRSLGRSAFTDLKHTARSSANSLFLAVTSFVRAIQLGGKGYAPPETHPLRRHVKGLTQFVHFTDQLEEILGENPEPSVAVAKILSSIRSAVLKGISSENPLYTAVEDTVKELKERIHQIHAAQKQSAIGTGISPARPRAYAINHATAYGGRETVKVLLALLDEEAVAPPCRNKAELLTEDHSLLDGAEAVCLLTLYRSPDAPSGLSPEPLQNRLQKQQVQLNAKVRERVIRSQFACTYRDDNNDDDDDDDGGLPLNRVLEFPSASQLPTCVHPAPKRLPKPATAIPDDEEEEEAVAKGNMTADSVSSVRGVVDPARKPALQQRSSNPRTRAVVPRGATSRPGPDGKASKRKLENGSGAERCDGDENQPPLKRPPLPKSSTARKNSKTQNNTKKLIAGQAKLTSFFRL